MNSLQARMLLSAAALAAFAVGVLLPRAGESFLSFDSPSRTSGAKLAAQDALALAAAPLPATKRLPADRPERVGLDSRTLARIDDLMAQRIAGGHFPGGVVLIARRGVVVKYSAYGNAVVHDEAGGKLAEPIPTRVDTIYDLASLTKLFTATTALTLVDQGALDLDAPVARYLPEFGANGKEEVTIRQLLTHTSGLPAGLGLSARGNGAEQRMRSAYQVKLLSKPGEKYLYSDAGPIVLGKVIERITGVGLDDYLRRAVLDPLGLDDTMYRPPGELRPRIAATEVQRASEEKEQAAAADGRAAERRARQTHLLWGEAHDPEARALDGVAGNAGLFGGAEDLAVFAQMMLEGGSYGGSKVLEPETVAAALRPQSPDNAEQGLGWELDQDWYMGGFGDGSFGHTGFTGTSLIVSPRQSLLIVVLTNRLHGQASGSTNSTRIGVADIVFAALRD